MKMKRQLQGGVAIITIITGIILIRLRFSTLVAMDTPKEQLLEEPVVEKSVRAEVFIAPETVSKLKALGLHTEQWALYHADSKAVVDSFVPASIKVIFQIITAHDVSYLVDVKRSHGNGGRKNASWEFPGGQVDSGEVPIRALQRELSEEDNTGILIAELKLALQKNSLVPLYYRNIIIKNGEKQTVFLVDLPHKKAEILLANFKPHKEIYKFELVGMKKLDMTKKKHRRLWTPRSQNILYALRS